MSQCLDGVADGSMQLPPPHRAQFVVQSHPDKVVPELVSAIGNLLDHMRTERFVQGFQQRRLAGPPRRAHQDVVSEIAADDRGDGEQLVAGGGQQVEPPTDDFRHPLGDGDRRGHCGEGCDVFCVKPALLFQEPYDLTQEQRVAFRLRPQGGGKRSGWATSYCRGKEFVYFLDIQSGQTDADQAGRPRQLAQKIGQRMPPRELRRAIGADQQYPVAGEFRRQELEQAERRSVGPMEVVQHQQNRAATA